jgi:Protein of unknown function (DUF3575)
MEDLCLQNCFLITKEQTRKIYLQCLMGIGLEPDYHLDIILKIMKTKKSITAAFLVFTSFSLFAQVEYRPKQQTPLPERTQSESTHIKKIPTEPPKENIIKINLLSPIFYTIMFSLQHNISEDKSLQITAGYMNFDGFNSSSSVYNSNYNSSNPHTEAYFFTPEYRYLFVGENMNGSYIAPFLKYTNMTYSADYTNYNMSYQQERFTFGYQTLGIGICIGQQFIYKNKISIDFFAGPVYNMLLTKTAPSNPNFAFNKIEIDNSINKINISGYGIRAGFTIGFLF